MQGFQTPVSSAHQRISTDCSVQAEEDVTGAVPHPAAGSHLVLAAVLVGGVNVNLLHAFCC